MTFDEIIALMSETVDVLARIQTSVTVPGHQLLGSSDGVSWANVMQRNLTDIAATWKYLRLRRNRTPLTWEMLEVCVRFRHVGESLIYYPSCIGSDGISIFECQSVSIWTLKFLTWAELAAGWEMQFQNQDWRPCYVDDGLDTPNAAEETQIVGTRVVDIPRETDSDNPF